jgi:hypothetical protein
VTQESVSNPHQWVVIPHGKSATECDGTRARRSMADESACVPWGAEESGGCIVGLILLVLVLVVLFGAFGFAVHVLWIVALLLLALWLIGFAVGRGESAGSHHWYRW